MNERAKRALCFLAERQRPSGEFRLSRGADLTLPDTTECKTVFGTAMVTRALLPHGDLPWIARALAHARAFLVRERDADGLWRFFGRGSDLAPDADDVACALLAFSSDFGDQDVLQRLVQNADRRGAVLTWLPEVGGVRPAVNEADPVVNANVYLLCRSRAFAAPTIRSYLETVIASSVASSRYYRSPFFFAFIVGDAIWSDFGPGAAQQLEVAVLDHVELAFDDVLQTALALGALSSCKSVAPVRRRLLESILDAQEDDGGWPVVGAFVEPRAEGPIWYGSRELTTSLCIDGLHRAVSS
jgi:hypothetical protein